MNQRINQLLGQAYDQAVPETWTELSSEQLGRVFDKFAELIVRECIDKISEEHKAALDDVMEDWDRGFLGGLSCAMETVQKHFGVEE